MVMVVDMKVFILSTLHTDEWEVNDIVGSYSWIFFQKGCDMLCVVMVVEMKTVSSFNISDNVKVFCVGG